MGAFQSITENILPHRSSPAEVIRVGVAGQPPPERRGLAGSVFFVLLVFSTGLVAQVKIQERVSITPQLGRDSSAFLHHPVDTSRWGASQIYSDSNQIRLEISWDQPVYTVRAYITSPWGELVVYGVGSTPPISYSFWVPARGDYNITPQACGPWPVGVNVTFTSRIFLNDTLVAQASVTEYLLGCCCEGYCYCVLNATAHYRYTPVPHVRFEVVSERDTLGSGDTAQVRAIALDAQEREVWVEPATLLTYRMQPDTLGRFINAAGDTVPAPLSNVRYQDARTGRIRLLANRIPPDTPRAATIEVVQMNDTTKRGSDTVWISNAAHVKITRPNSVNVYPTYPLYNDSTTKKNWMALELKVMSRDSSLVPNYWVRLDSAVLVDSGGHSHNGTRPKPRYIVPKLTGVGVDTIVSGVRKTDSTGVLKFKYLASEFGGVERIRARLLSDTTKWDTLSLMTRVPGLDSLGPGTHYVLVGAPHNHSGTNDPCRPDPPTSQHYRNHYGTSRLRLAVQQIANAYDSLHSGIRLRINDMSLVYGGLFDASHNEPPPKNRPWLPPHSDHRIGVNADIGYKGMNAQNQCVDIDTTHIKKIIWDKTKKRPVNHRPPGPPAPHFHIYVKKD